MELPLAVHAPACQQIFCKGWARAFLRARWMAWLSTTCAQRRVAATLSFPCRLVLERECCRWAASAAVSYHEQTG